MKNKERKCIAKKKKIRKINKQVLKKIEDTRKLKK